MTVETVTPTIMTLNQGKELLDRYQNVTYETIEARTAALMEELADNHAPSSETFMKDTQETNNFLENHSFTIICPIPLPDIENEPLFPSDKQEKLNHVFEMYLHARGLTYVKTESKIYTKLVFDAELEEMTKLARTFYQEFMLHSSNGENILLETRGKEGAKITMKGKGWSSPEQGDATFIPLTDGGEFRFWLNLE